MTYLNPSDYELFGLAADTSAGLVAATSALVDAHCRRVTIAPHQYRERLRLAAQSRTVRLTFLPLMPIAPATSALISAKGRYGPARRGEYTTDFAADIAQTFGLPGDWTELDVSSLDVDPDSGELTLPRHPLGLGFNEVEVVYTAGHETIPDAVKLACAQLIRNAQATPALNVRAGSIDRMHLDYFSDSLLDSTVRELLAPYVAQKVA
jgi:hypothetical protein